jgi:sulfatase maturation enzyme AslB (radical SAM superfamily)
MEGKPMSELEDIGFYTLNDKRAAKASQESRLERCELLLTRRCNFRCPYCRSVGDEISFDEACEIVRLWANQGLQAVRLSGGEPTLWLGLLNLVLYAANLGIERIALSTNGSADTEFYKELVTAGVNDFSISLDACCAEDNERMTGGAKGVWESVVENIRELSKLTYVTVGVVLTGDNTQHTGRIIDFAAGLGVADIRVIPAAQEAARLMEVSVPLSTESLFPILRYRISNARHGRPVRGIRDDDTNLCPLVLDDMAVCGDRHYPCIIYLREGGIPIGQVGARMREARHRWFMRHNTHTDPICGRNCLDVCVAYNNRWMEMHGMRKGTA